MIQFRAASLEYQVEAGVQGRAISDHPDQARHLISASALFQWATDRWRWEGVSNGAGLRPDISQHLEGEPQVLLKDAG